MTSMLRIATVVAYLFSSAACAQECVALPARDLGDVYAQLRAARDRAYTDYFLGQPEASVRSLSKLAEVYARSQCTDAVPQEVRSVFQRDEVLERARLVREYQRLGDGPKASNESKRAVKLGQEVFRNAAFSEADLLSMVAKADPAMEKEVRSVITGRDSDRKN